MIFGRRHCVLATAIVFAALSSLLLPLPEAAYEATSVRSIRVMDRNGLLLREVRPEGRGIPVRLGDLPAFVSQAVVAAEDRAFYRHPGVDPVAAVRAAFQAIRSGRIVSGASTITMQVARMIRGRSGPRWLDKLAEMHLALRLEARLTKQGILALWLNRAYFGSQAYGVEAAARTYFGKSARDLTVAEAALLVGLAQSPSRYDPFRRPDLALGRRQYVLRSMEISEFLTPGEGERYRSLPVDLEYRRSPFHAPHLVQRVAEGAFESLDAPIEIRTTVDRQLQQEVTALAAAHLETLKEMQAGNAAVLVVDNATGDVLAYVGNPDFWDEPSEGQNDGVRMLRQPGSALKPFTYGHALRSRAYTAASILADVETPVLEAGGAFSPENYDRRFHGPVPLRTALASSYNVPAVRLAREFGPAALLETLHEAGFHSLDRPARKYGVGLTLGNGEVTLEELAQAYAALAGGGAAPPLRYEVFRSSVSGETVRSHAHSRRRSIGFGEDVAFILTDILSDPQAREPAFGRGGPLELPFPCAVKTGTSKNYRDNWAVGYTPKHTVAVWVGNFDGKPMRTVAGVSGAGTLLKSVFQLLGPGGDFDVPDSVGRTLICPVSGQRPSRLCPTRRYEIFLRGTEPRGTCDVHRHVRIDTRTGERARKDTPVEFVEERVFEVHPPVFHAWMREQGIFVSEPSTKQTEEERMAEAQGLPASPRPIEGLVISYPESGMVFQIDAVLRREYQRFEPRGSAAPGLVDVKWWLDGERLDQPFDDVQIPLEPGRQVLQLRARGPQGRVIESRESVFVVLGLEAIAGAAAPSQSVGHAEPDANVIPNRR